MTRLVRSLTAANGKAYGIERAEQFDFRDDGASFKGYIYKGMPLTQHVSKDYGTFLCIRTDYCRNNFTWKDWAATEEYKLEDEFNGCAQVDLDKLVANLDAIIAKVAEMNAAACVDEAELGAAVNKAEAQLADAEARLEAVKANAAGMWWTLGEYKVKRAADYLRSQEREIERYRTQLAGIKTAPVREQRDFIQRGISVGGFYIKELEEMFNGRKT